MALSKIYSRINWVNEEEPALNETNLNKVDYALDVIDDRVVELDITKAKQSDLNESLKTLTFDQETGVFTFEYWNGSQLICDLNVEKIPVSFSLSDEGILKMVTDDGTEWTCDISKLIKTYSFLNSETINFEDTVDENGNHNVTAKVKIGSITGEHLQPNYLADITKQANLSKDSSENSKSSSLISEGFAKGTQNGEPVGEDSEYYNNNAEYFKNQAQSMSKIGNGLIKVKQGENELGSFTTNQSEDVIINIPEATNIEVDIELSSTSENPVQNKVVTTKLGTINEDLMSKVDLPTDEEGNVDFGEEGKVLTSNGDGTFSWGKGSGGATITPKPTVNPKIESDDGKVIITWEDPTDTVIEGSTFSKWAGTKLVMKESGYPTSPDDGEILVDNTVRDKYKTSGFTKTGLTNDKVYYFALFPYSTDGIYNYDSGNRLLGEPTRLKIVTFDNGTDEEIAKMVEAHYSGKINISDYWSVGNKRTVHLSAMEATGVGESHREQDVEYVIGDFEHDDLVTSINGHTKAAVTLLQKDCLMDASNATNPQNGSGNTENGYMNSSYTNSGGWKSCARRTWCNNVYYNALPSTLKSIVKTVNKKSGTGGGSSSGTETTQDKIFLAAEIEIFGSTNYSVSGEGTQYQYYKNATANRYKMPKWNSSSVSHVYWERSPDSGTSTDFCIVTSNGNANTNFASTAFGVAPCLCI